MNMDSSYEMIEIKSELQLPYQLIVIDNVTTCFSFSFLQFDTAQSKYSIDQGGVMGKFGLGFHEAGIDTNIVCDVSVGNVFSFYTALKQHYNSLNGVATLSDYGNRNTKICVAFESTGQCKLSGSVRNHSSASACGTLCFEMSCDQSYFRSSLARFERFFDELARIQGYFDFRY